VLLDPYARAVAYGDNWSRAEAYGFHDNTYSALKSVVLDPSAYDWEGDQPLRRPMSETVIYEVHARNLTAHPSSGVLQPGTYAGVIAKLPYLLDLGITAIELLPVQQFDEQEVERTNPMTGEPLKNHWGYAPLVYFAPHLGYCHGEHARQAPDRFRDMVKALHRAGIEIILDVVFNHTAESHEAGPTISFRGLENAAYYMLKPDRRLYQDFAGCGNTVNANHPVVRGLILDCLRYWVQEYHIDGFRFDLAAVLTRGEGGEPLADPPLLREIESDPVLAGTKLIAEPWDAAGLWQLGAFPGERWAEWNGRFRDDLRRFVRGDAGMTRDLAARMAGSHDLFRDGPGRAAHRSINYVTCHDGFTLADLVSYNVKHNEANGEGNHDGADQNWSCNHGVEGPTDDPHVRALRHKQMKNLIALLMMARGIPMLLGGDEFGRTQQGNNNAYCQDNALSWFDWRFLSENADLYRFVRGMIAIRRRYRALRPDGAVGQSPCEQSPDGGITFHGAKLHEPDWGPDSRALAVRFASVQDADLYVIANANEKALPFELPADARWRRVVDTGLVPPDDLIEEGEAPLMDGSSYTVGGRSVVILVEAR